MRRFDWCIETRESEIRSTAAAVFRCICQQRLGTKFQILTSISAVGATRETLLESKTLLFLYYWLKIGQYQYSGGNVSNLNLICHGVSS